MRSAHTNRRSIAQRARRDAEAEARPIRQGPPQIPHGTVVGRIAAEELKFQANVVVVVRVRVTESRLA